jgi:hypothetical protein
VQEVHPESPAWSQVKQDEWHPRHSLEEGKNPFGQFSMHYLSFRLSNPVQDVHPESPAWSQVKQDESHPRHSLEEGKNPLGQFSIH